jgi:hypothetical protein
MVIVVILGLHLQGYSQQGEISGRIIDSLGEPVPFATIAIERSSKGVAANDLGYYYLGGLDAGTYTVVFQSIGFKRHIVKDVKVLSDNTTELDAILAIESILGPEATVTEFKWKLIDPERPPVMDFISSTDLKNMPLNDIGEAIGYTASVTPVEGGGFSFRGARPGGNAYFIDGIRIKGEPDIPARGVYSMQVIPSGIPAKYGDVTGGVVVIETGSYYHR